MLALKWNSQLILGALLTAMMAVSPAVAEEEHEDEHGEELVQMSPSELKEFSIGIETAGAGSVELKRTLPAEVKINENKIAHIRPRYSGVAKQVNATIGDIVESGDVLAVIESDESLATYKLKTLLAGTVIEKHMTLGEPVDKEESGFMVADLSTVWIDITVYQRDLDTITVGKQVSLVSGTGKLATVGVIDYVTPVVDPHTRTATARLEVENHTGHWRPGMFVTAEVRTESFDAEVVIPATALLSIDGKDVVFVQQDEGFEIRAVEVGRRGAMNLEVVNGLRAGERYVSVGGFTLKAEAGKESFGDGDDH